MVQGNGIRTDPPTIRHSKDAEGTLASTGAEDEVWSKSPDSPFAIDALSINLTNMAFGDRVTPRLYRRYSSGGGWILDTTYPELRDAPTDKTFKITDEPGYYGLRVTLEQTAGSPTNFDYVVVTRDE